ncbi:MAG: carboxypeptidase-like regulatory domain-containing protein, partial [Candidatus Acidiferrum sp.]
MKRTTGLLVAVLSLAVSVLAGVGGSISGTVTDPAGRTIPGATVVALNVDTGVRNSTETNSEGFYS